MGTLLVCDDSRFQREILTSIIEKTGHPTFKAANSHKCPEKPKINKPDPIFPDLQMPDNDGCPVLTEARERGPDSPIIAITADSQDGTRSECPELCAQAFLNKPVDLDAVEEIILEIPGTRG